MNCLKLLLKKFNMMVLKKIITICNYFFLTFFVICIFNSINGCIWFYIIIKWIRSYEIKKRKLILTDKFFYGDTLDVSVVIVLVLMMEIECNEVVEN